MTQPAANPNPISEEQSETQRKNFCETHKTPHTGISADFPNFRYLHLSA
jgi:hypothetical protein